MRRANGSGTVYKLSGKRRKPWMARVTVGWSESGKQQYKNIGTYATKKEAQEALDSYFYVPETIKEMTLKEAYEGWNSMAKVAKSTAAHYASAYKKLSRFYALNVSALTLEIMQDAVDTPPLTTGSATAIKKLLSVLIEYAYIHDCCPASRKGLLQYVQVPERSTSKEKRIFTDDEIQSCIDQKAYGAIVLLFTGMRIDELINLKREDVHLDEGWIHVSKSKTAAGIRDIPIPDRLIPFLKCYLDSPYYGKGTTYFYNEWYKTPCLNGHTRHECRHTYITKMTSAGVDQRLIKAIVGHAGTITENVYTHFSIQEMREAVNSVFSKYLPAEFDANAEAHYELQA